MAALHTLDGVLVEAVPAELALYPFGVFTTFVLVDGGVLGWSDHVARLAEGTEQLWGHALDERRVAHDVLAHADHLSGAASVRVTLFPADLAIASPAAASGCRVLVSSRPVDFPFLTEATFTVGTAEFARELPQVKSTSVLGQIRLRREAQLAGYDDVLFRRGEEVLEGATWAVLVWKDGEVATPGDGVLASTSAKHLGAVAARLGRELRVRRVAVPELLRADLVQAASVNHPARAISSLDGETVPVDVDLLGEVARTYASLPRDLLQR